VTTGSQKTGETDFGPKAGVDKAGILIRWFSHWLKGEDNGVDRDPAVRYFVLGHDDWRESVTWPPPGAEAKTMYLGKGSGAAGAGLRSAGILSTRPPAADENPDSYVYDPRNPVPTLWDNRFMTQPPDRRKLEYRSDILYYCSDALAQDLEIAGEPTVKIYVASSAKDTDFFARLVDERFGGPALEVSYGMVRVRHRNGTDREDLLAPGEIAELTIKLSPTACRFRAGNRIRLEITSSDFPNFDRNHNTGGDDLGETTLVSATQEVYHTHRYASLLTLPVMRNH
jgi:putative CocE/NonD family hydrolase